MEIKISLFKKRLLLFEINSAMIRPNAKKTMLYLFKKPIPKEIAAQ